MMIGKLDRRDFLKLAALGTAGSTMPNLVLAAEKQRRPYNVIFIMGDDYSTNQIGCYGSTECRTPNIDRLAKTGVQFETCWATPLCNPSRVELLTGRYGFRTRFYHNWMTPDERVTEKNLVYPQILKNAGISTAMAGKWHHKGPPWEYGFDESCVVWGSRQSWTCEEFPEKPGYHFWQPCVVKNGKYMPTGPDDFSGDICVDFLIDFITRHQARPFFAYFPTMLGHIPFQATPDSLTPGEDRLLSRQENFKAHVEYVDKLVGRIVATVNKLGLCERTIIFFTTDNGTPPHKQHATERGCRVPMIVNCPSVIKLSGTCGELIDFSDMFPTFVDLAGAKLPRDYEIDGRSFGPLLLQDPYQGREWVFSYLGPGRMLRDKHWLLEGSGRFFDCDDRRDGIGYKDVTESKDSKVLAAKIRFREILEKLPPPAEDDPLFDGYRKMVEEFGKAHQSFLTDPTAF